jgi:hypothetical protein
MNIREFYDSLTPEQIEHGNRRQLEENKQVYEEFTSAYKQGNCSLCGHLLTEFISNKPCFHWFLRPHGIKKKHFQKYLSTPIGFFRFDCYLRWIANLESPYKNINDLKSEMNPAKVIEYTIRYKKIDWSVSIGKTDRQGHPDTKNAKFPHFHIQMKFDNNVFIKFNDFHIPFSDEDIFTLRSMEEAPDKVVWRNSFGEGMSILEDHENLKKLDELMLRTDDTENATFYAGTLIKMPKGETMNGETISKAFKESKETGIPVRHILNKYFPQASFMTEISPGEGVPGISKRKARK